MIPYGRQNLNSKDIEAVSQALLDDFITQGPRIASFEAALAVAVGARHAIAVNSATSALHLACLALGVGKGDEVWTTAISFVASANAARYCGAEVDFVDIEPESFNISVSDLRRKLEERIVQKRATPKVLIVVHMAGQPCDMREIADLSVDFNFRVIEDASHALGSQYGDKPTGGCEFSDITVFSFHAVKMITTGEGGACVTNNHEYAARIQRLRSHGITRDPNEMSGEYPGSWYYEQLELGFNYRITDFQAALGESQLSKLDDFVNKRNDVAKWYDTNITEPGISLPVVGPGRSSSFHLYIIRLSDEVARKSTFERLRSQGILVNMHYLPIYRHPYYANFGKYSISEYPNAELHNRTTLSLPIFPQITEDELDAVKKALVGLQGFQNIF